MHQAKNTKQTTQSSNGKANTNPDDKEIEKMVTDEVEKAKLSEIGEVKVYIHEQINAFRAEVNLKFAEVNSKFDKVDSKFNALQQEMNSKFDTLQQEMSKYFRWTVGIIITLFLATLAL